MEKYNDIKNRGVSVVFAVALAILILTFSIGLPIYFRPFYYVQIDTLDMVERTGYSYEVIKAAYDEVLNYLTLPWCEFGTGELAWSESGASHFADCLFLFNLNAAALIISAAIVIVVLILSKRGVISLAKPLGLNLGFWSGASLLGVFGLLALLVSQDFNTAFTVFHALFFPGKDNWVFNPYTDEIIKVMPQEFFMNCAILIVSSIILISLTLIVLGIVGKAREKMTSRSDGEASPET